MYPDKKPEEREDIFAKENGTIFIEEIGHELKDGIKHGDRASDYDDWNLNGDIIIWSPILKRSIELSSMGIRVDKESALKQIEIKKEKETKFSKSIIDEKLKLTMGGGIGQSRIVMAILQAKNITEVQPKFWK